MGHTISTHDPGAVQCQHHVKVLKTYIVKHLVISALGEGGIQGNHRNEAIGRHTCSHSHGMFFRDGHVEETKFHALSKLGKAGTGHHGSTNSYHFFMLLTYTYDGIGKSTGKCFFAGRLYTLFLVKRRNTMVGRWILFCERVALTFLCCYMDQYRAIDLLGDLNLFLKKRNVMTIKRSIILEPQILEDNRSISADHKTEPGLYHTEEPGNGTTDKRHFQKELLYPVLGTDISCRCTKVCQRTGKPTNVLIN